MMCKKHLFALLSAIFLLVGVAHSQQSMTEQEFLTQHGLQDKTPTEIVNYIDQLPQSRPLPYSAAVTSTQLKLSDGKNMFTYPLEGKFYLSIAPYVNYTHDCFNHSLSGCRGELTQAPYHVKVKDDAGNVIFDENVVSFSNGFYGLWLPRNINGTVEVSYNGLQGQSSFTTSASGQTCMTTIRLK